MPTEPWLRAAVTRPGQQTICGKRSAFTWRLAFPPPNRSYSGAAAWVVYLWVQWWWASKTHKCPHNWHIILSCPWHLDGHYMTFGDSVTSTTEKMLKRLAMRTRMSHRWQDAWPYMYKILNWQIHITQWQFYLLFFKIYTNIAKAQLQRKMEKCPTICGKIFTQSALPIPINRKTVVEMLGLIFT